MSNFHPYMLAEVIFMATDELMLCVCVCVVIEVVCLLFVVCGWF